MKNLKIRKKSAVSIAVLSVVLAGYAACANELQAAVNVPIIITEALPLDITGINRTNDPVTVGIPLKDSDAISDISQLGVSGSSVGQFRVLKRYPSGNIWWVLADMQASVTAGGSVTLNLTDGSGNFGGSDLANDSSGIIEVNTGAAQI